MQTRKKFVDKFTMFDTKSVSANMLTEPAINLLRLRCTQKNIKTPLRDLFINLEELHLCRVRRFDVQLLYDIKSLPNLVSLTMEILVGLSLAAVLDAISCNLRQLRNLSIGFSSIEIDDESIPVHKVFDDDIPASFTNMTKLRALTLTDCMPRFYPAFFRTFMPWITYFKMESEPAGILLSQTSVNWCPTIVDNCS